LFKAAEIMEGMVDELSRLLTREEGKTLQEARAEVVRAVEIFRFYAGAGYRIYGQTIPSADPAVTLYTIREPIGVISIITPWNFPIAIPAWKIAPALISGNAVVFKPASYTPLIALKLVEALEKAGLPPGIVNFVTGSGLELGDEMVRNPKIGAITFTGSHDTGAAIYRLVHERSRTLRIQLEMGGKNATVVMEDADLDQAVDVVVRGAFSLTGQACTATERVLVHEKIYDMFLRRLVERTARIRLGNGLEKDVDMGPLVGENEKKKVLSYYELGREEGAKLLYGGGEPEGEAFTYGYFVEPTIFADATPDMRICQEEIFGPVVAAIPISNIKEATEIANNSEYGLVASICTKNLAYVKEFAENIETGIVKVNRPTIGVELQAPFGGVKNSGSDTYREQGDMAIDFFTRIKTVYLGI
jgi:aldehyde dehydrogenase (NAD+)